MKIFISDTNIFIDLISIDLLDAFLELPIEIQTNDFVLNELSEDKKALVESKIEKNKILLNEADEKEIDEIKILHAAQKGLSFQDMSVFFHARKNKTSILTGDKKLKMFAKQKNIECRGILWILDEIEKTKLISKPILAKKLAKLITINSWLPKSECEQRINEWKNA